MFEQTFQTDDNSLEDILRFFFSPHSTSHNAATTIDTGGAVNASSSLTHIVDETGPSGREYFVRIKPGSLDDLQTNPPQRFIFRPRLDVEHRPFRPFSIQKFGTFEMAGPACLPSGELSRIARMWHCDLETLDRIRQLTESTLLYTTNSYICKMRWETSR